MPGRNQRRRQDTNVIMATPVSLLELTPVQSVSIEDHATEEITNRWADLTAANQILGEKWQDLSNVNQILREKSSKLIETNDKLRENLNKIKIDIDKKTKRIDELENKVTSNSLAIQMYKDKIKELMNENKVIKERAIDLELSSRTIYNLHRENKEKCIGLKYKLNKVRSELPLNFDKEEWNNKYFVNYLIDLTLEDIEQIQF